LVEFVASNGESAGGAKGADAEDKLKVLIAPGVKHQVTMEQRQAALAWLEKWLK
jgi:hypothetical protein